MLLVAFLLFIVVLYFVGPKVPVDTRYTIPDLPDDLDGYLQSREARFDDITENTEKVIHWANPATKEKTPLAFVYFHGFSATRQETMPVPELVAKHFDSNIYYARLTGNGRSADAMALGTVNRWVNDASEALTIASQIGERTIIIGSSTGASLGWWASCQKEFQPQIASLVFFSPNFGVADSRGTLLTIRWGKQLAKAIIGNYRETEAYSEAHAKYWTLRYPTEALLPMMGMVKVARKNDPSLCNQPVFVTYSPHDDTVSASKIQQFCQSLKCNKRILKIDAPEDLSQHVIVGDILAPQNNRRVTDAVIDFIETEVVNKEALS